MEQCYSATIADFTGRRSLTPGDFLPEITLLCDSNSSVMLQNHGNSVFGRVAWHGVGAASLQGENDMGATIFDANADTVLVALP